jgi:hypothetical protein
MPAEERQNFVDHLKKLGFPDYKFSVEAFLSRNVDEYVCLDSSAHSFSSCKTHFDLFNVISHEEWINRLCGVSAEPVDEENERIMQAWNNHKLFPGCKMMCDSEEHQKQVLLDLVSIGIGQGTSSDRFDEFPCILIDEDLDAIGTSNRSYALTEKDFYARIAGKGELTPQILASAIAKRKDSSGGGNPLSALFAGLGRM